MHAVFLLHRKIAFNSNIQLDLADHADMVSGIDKDIWTFTVKQKWMSKKKWHTSNNWTKFPTTGKTVFWAHYHIDIPIQLIN